ADDEPYATALRDVTPDGRSRTLLVDVRLEAGGAACGDDGVVIAGRHVAWPELERLVPQRRQLDLLLLGKRMFFRRRETGDLAPDPPLLNVVRIGRQRRQRDVAVAVEEERRHVAPIDLARVDLQMRKLGAESIEDHRDRVEGADERVHEPKRSCLAT